MAILGQRTAPALGKVAQALPGQAISPNLPQGPVQAVPGQPQQPLGQPPTSMYGPTTPSPTLGAAMGIPGFNFIGRGMRGGALSGAATGALGGAIRGLMPNPLSAGVGGILGGLAGGFRGNAQPIPQQPLPANIPIGTLMGGLGGWMGGGLRNQPIPQQQPRPGALSGAANGALGGAIRGLYGSALTGIPGIYGSLPIARGIGNRVNSINNRIDRAAGKFLPGSIAPVVKNVINPLGSVVGGAKKLWDKWF